MNFRRAARPRAATRLANYLAIESPDLDEFKPKRVYLVKHPVQLRLIADVASQPRRGGSYGDGEIL
jgi:hypothetical protein